MKRHGRDREQLSDLLSGRHSPGHLRKNRDKIELLLEEQDFKTPIECQLWVYI